MGQVNIPSGGMRANVRAFETIPTDTVWKYGQFENEIWKCGGGEEADGICLAEVTAETICNNTGICYSRKTTGVFDDVTYSGTLTVGSEWMSGAAGEVVAYIAAGDNRPLGKVLAVDDTTSKAKLSLYAR